MMMRGSGVYVSALIKKNTKVMGFYWRTDRLSYFEAAIRIKERMPFLDKEDVYFIEDRLKGSSLDFYRKESKRVPVWIRFTVVPAFVFYILLMLFMPINFLFTGKWGYNKVWIANWFKALGW